MWKNWITMSLLWSSLTSGNSQLFEMSTKNVAVAVGQPSNISRHSNPTDNISQLMFTPSWSTKEFPIWSLGIGKDSKNFTDPFTVLKVHSIVTLYINSTSLNSSGTFTWKVTSPSEGAHHVKKSTVQLIVLDGNPTCSSTIGSSVLHERESVEMQCSIRYRGNWAPVMEWRFSGKDGQVVREGVQATQIGPPNSSVVYAFNFTVSYTMNNRNVSCKTHFSKYTGNVTTTATNIPDYSYTWTSPALKVTYGPKNLLITPVKESYKPGDKLTCSADANPSPIYEWKDTTEFGSLKSGEDFNIPSFASPFTVECTASNSVGSNSSSITIYLSPGLEPLMYLLICLGSLCFLLFLLILLISGKQIKARCTIFCEKRKRKQVTTANTEAGSNGTTFLGHDNIMANPQLTLPGNERHPAIYATVDKKAKKQKKVKSADIMQTTTNPTQTYIGADQTEYLEMGRFGSLTAGGFVHPDRHPPPMRPRQYEPVVYASIDHNLSAPMPKMKNPK